MNAPDIALDCWPDRRQRLLLRAALLVDGDALDAWHAWKSEADFDQLDYGSARILPLLYRNLTSLQICDPLLRRLKGIYRRTWYANQLALRDLAGLLRELEEARVDSLVLKDVAMILRYYGDIGLRPVDDLDILIPAEQVPAALDVLAGLGWKPRVGMPSPKTVKTSSPCLEWENATARRLTFHCRLMREEGEPGADTEWWDGRTPVVHAGFPTHVLNPADQLLHLCVIWARWNPLPPLRWAADAMTIVNTARSELDWDRLSSKARRWGLTLPVRDTLQRLRDLLDAPIPPEVLRDLRRVRVSPFERVEYRLRTRQPQSASPLERVVSEYLQLPHRRRRLAALQEVLGFTAFLQKYWGLKHHWQVPLWAGLKGVQRVRKVILGLPRTTRGSWSRPR